MSLQPSAISRQGRRLQASGIRLQAYWLLRFVLTVTILLEATRPAPLAAQADSAQLHVTLQSWADRTWLLVLDRGAAADGRLTDRGTLLRFHPDIDGEHQLDLISASFSPADDYVWHQRPNGVRYWTSSINHRDLVAGVNVKANAALGRGWTARALFDKEDGPPIRRNLLRIGFEKEWTGGPFGFFEGTLLPMKPEMDLTLGGGWRGLQTDASLSLTWLDAFNDAIYQGLVVDEGFADTAIDYEKQAFALRATVKQSVAARLRLEVHGAFQFPARIRAYRQVAPDSGFRQEEEFGFVGGLIEWSFAPMLRAGALATHVRAVSDRTPLPLGEPTNDYRLVERTTNVGVYLLTQPQARWRFEGWVARQWRPELREHRSGAAPTVDYEDRTWHGQLILTYRALSGFRTSAAFEMDLRDVVRGEGQVPVRVTVDERNMRLRLEGGWQFGDRFQASAGYRIDIDGRGAGGRFDGAHGRFVMYW